MDIKEIREFYNQSKIKWSKHCLERMQERDIKCRTTHVVNYNDCVIIIKNVPCEECEQCEEKFYSDEVSEQLEIIVNNSKKLLQEISVIDYSKIA